MDTFGHPRVEGDPSPQSFLWNGDWVDRGAFGLEVVLLLFAWKLVWPKSVYLQRGNHEDRGQNEYYNRETHNCWGFMEEVAVKYPGKQCCLHCLVPPSVYGYDSLVVCRFMWS